MERSEALNLIKRQLDTVIPTLEALEAKVKPEFQKRGLRLFDVGLDVVKTAVDERLSYTVMVYDHDHKSRILASDVGKVVRSVAPDYQGHIGVISGAIFYPLASILNLQFLKDLQKM